MPSTGVHGLLHSLTTNFAIPLHLDHELQPGKDGFAELFSNAIWIILNTLGVPQAFDAILGLLFLGALVFATHSDLGTRRLEPVHLELFGLLGIFGGIVHGLYLLAGVVSGHLLMGQVYLAGAATLLGVSIPYLAWKLGGFGGGDAKALIALAVAFPMPVTIYLPEQIGELMAGVIPMTGLPFNVLWLATFTNTLLVTIAVPVAVLARNLAHGDLHRYAFLAHRVPTDSLDTATGRLIQPGVNGFGISGADLDDVRRYLDWRNISLAEIRANPEAYRSLSASEQPSEPGDGRVITDGDGDPWGVDAFYEENWAYATSPAELRAALNTIATEDDVIVSPGIPFFLPLTAGYILAFTVGTIPAFIFSLI